MLDENGTMLTSPFVDTVLSEISCACMRQPLMNLSPNVSEIIKKACAC